MHVYTYKPTSDYHRKISVVLVHVLHCHIHTQVMETAHHIYLVTEYASKGEIFGKVLFLY